MARQCVADPSTYGSDRTQSDMMFDVPRLIEHCSSIMTLEEGDSILTGTVRRCALYVLADLASPPSVQYRSAALTE